MDLTTPTHIVGVAAKVIQLIIINNRTSLTYEEQLE